MVFLKDKEYTSVHSSHPSVEGGAFAESCHSPIFSNFVFPIIRTVMCFSTSAGNIVYLLSGAPNENIVQNHLNIALLNVF